MAARQQNEVAVTLSVLDRLLDYEPKNRQDDPLTRRKSKDLYEDAVRRDLEWLLNSHQIADLPAEGLKEAHRSFYTYGLPDLTSFSMNSPQDQARLMRVLQTAIRLFEPRLANVRVLMVEDDEGSRQMLRFRIEGLLRMNPSPEPISFDTVLDVTTKTYSIRGNADAG